MISIGERINGMFKDVREAIKNKDPKGGKRTCNKANRSRGKLSGCECRYCYSRSCWGNEMAD